MSNKFSNALVPSLAHISHMVLYWLEYERVLFPWACFSWRYNIYPWMHQWINDKIMFSPNRFRRTVRRLFEINRVASLLKIFVVLTIIYTEIEILIFFRYGENVGWRGWGNNLIFFSENFVNEDNLKPFKLFGININLADFHDTNQLR